MKRILAGISVGVLPLVALAQAYTPANGIGGLITLLGSLLQAALPVLISLAVVWFVWNVFRYVIAGSDEEKTKARVNMIWGIVGIFVMVSIWGLVSILANTFGTQGTTADIGDQLPI